MTPLPGCGRQPGRKVKGMQCGEHASPNAGAARLGLSLKQAFR